MSIFKKDREIKRMIFNIYSDTAERLEQLKDQAKLFDKRLDIDTAVNKALEKFISKAEKKMDEMRREGKAKRSRHNSPQSVDTSASASDTSQCSQDESASG